MLEDDQDTLAAEYVLGTLSADERAHAEALLSFDPGFEAAVHQWERRLGELNVMVEAVEPPAELWDKIKKETIPDAPAVTAAAASDTPAPSEQVPPHDLDTSSTVAALTSDLMTFEQHAAAASAQSDAGAADDLAGIPPPLYRETPEVEHSDRVSHRGSDNVIDLAKSVRRWRGSSFTLGAIAALLALYVAASQVAPGLLPPALRPAGSGVVARTEGGGATQDRLVAVLQQQPTGPAFILTVDTQRRTLVVRRVTAAADTGRSYELWLIAGRSSAPRSLGVVSNDEFTQRPLPANVDVDALRAATFAVSLEPTGGSPSGAPTGPVLFTGKAVETLPAAPPRPAKS